VVADTLPRLPGSETLSKLVLCSSTYTLGIYHVNHVDDEINLDYNEQLHGIISLYENDTLL
jgi:hypothetical protein